MTFLSEFYVVKIPLLERFTVRYTVQLIKLVPYQVKKNFFKNVVTLFG